MNFLNDKIKTVRVTKDRLSVELEDGRSISAPLAWYPTLLEASASQRAKWKQCGAGTGIYWPGLDYHLSVEGLLRGVPEAPGIRRAKRRQAVAA